MLERATVSTFLAVAFTPGTGLVVAALLLAAAAQAGPKPAQPHPNILVILAGDLAAWHLGCYGNRAIRTPNLDRLAAEGVRMTHAYVHTPVCSPSRATFFTGRTSRQHGIEDFLTPEPLVNPPQGQKEPPPSFSREIMISDLLAASGYRCGYIGEWDMGGEERPQHNFEFWYAWLAGASEPYHNPEMSWNGQRVQEKGYTPEVWTRRATEFIRKRSGLPWFLVVAYPHPHTPYPGHPQRYDEMYAGERFEGFGIEPRALNALREANKMDDPIQNLRLVAAATTALDDQIAPLVAALAESRQRNRTLILFTADRGSLFGRHGAWSARDASNAAGMYEEMIQVPLIYSYPGRLPGGRVLDHLVSFYDALPTLLDTAAAELPGGFRAFRKKRNLPGHSYWPMLLGQPQPWTDEVYCTFRTTDAIRDPRYKLVLRNYGAGPDELFDAETDPAEKINRIHDPALGPVRWRLERRLENWVKQYR